jgi:hypothetical protein
MSLYSPSFMGMPRTFPPVFCCGWSIISIIGLNWHHFSNARCCDAQTGPWGNYRFHPVICENCGGSIPFLCWILNWHPFADRYLWVWSLLAGNHLAENYRFHPCCLRKNCGWVMSTHWIWTGIHLSNHHSRSFLARRTMLPFPSVLFVTCS